MQAAKYADVATKNLFSKDRNPTVDRGRPKVEAPKAMPPLPVVYGVLSLPAGPKPSWRKSAGSASRSVGVARHVGEFKILAMDGRKVTFEWDGKPIERISTIWWIIPAARSGRCSRGCKAAGPAATPPPATGEARDSSVSGRRISERPRHRPAPVSRAKIHPWEPWWTDIARRRA